MFQTISSFLPAVVWTLGSGVILTIGDVTLRSWLQTRWSFGFEVTLLIYMFGVLCLMMSFFHQNIAVATIAAIIINAAGYLFASYWLYGDTISPLAMAGMILGVIAIALLEMA